MKIQGPERKSNGFPTRNGLLLLYNRSFFPDKHPLYHKIKVMGLKRI